MLDCENNDRRSRESQPCAQALVKRKFVREANVIRFSLYALSALFWAMPSSAQIAEVRSIAEQRLAMAWLNEAAALEHGEEATKDQPKAAELYCKSARLGNAEASFRLGWMYANGRGVVQDDGIAVALVQRASEGGYNVPESLLRFLQSTNVRLPECMLTTNTAVAANTAVATAANLKSRVAIVAPRADVVAAPARDLAAVKQSVTDAITIWAAAWSSQNVEAYLASYAPTFRSFSGSARSAWESERRARIVGKARITISVEELQIRVDGATAKARFRQQYLSDRLEQKNQKVLTLVEIDGKWLIQEEVADGG
jgi:hypothetical protein